MRCSSGNQCSSRWTVAVIKLSSKNWGHFYFVEALTVNQLQSASESSDYGAIQIILLTYLSITGMVQGRLQNAVLHSRLDAAGLMWRMVNRRTWTGFIITIAMYEYMQWTAVHHCKIQTTCTRRWSLNNGHKNGRLNELTTYWRWQFKLLKTVKTVFASITNPVELKRKWIGHQCLHHTIISVLRYWVHQTCSDVLPANAAIWHPTFVYWIKINHNIVAKKFQRTKGYLNYTI